MIFFLKTNKKFSFAVSIFFWKNCTYFLKNLGLTIFAKSESFGTLILKLNIENSSAKALRNTATFDITTTEIVLLQQF